MTNIGIGITGSGFMARTYAECLSRYVPNAHLKAVTGGRRAPGLAHDYGVAYEPSLDALLERSDVQAIIITTPEMVHKAATLAAAAAGKHVLVEKPMAPDVAQCDAMIESCAAAGVKLMVIQSQRFRGVHQRARTILDDGKIGEVHQIHYRGLQSIEHAHNLVTNKPFYLDPEGGGLFMGVMVHGFDMVRWLAGGEAISMSAQLSSFGDHEIPDLSLLAQVEFDNGVAAQVWWSAEQPGVTFPGSRFRTKVTGSRGLLDCDGYHHLDLGTSAGWERLWEQPAFDPKDPLDPLRLESFSAMINEFVAAIREDRSPAVTGEDGRAAVAMCEAARESARLGQVVAISDWNGN